MVEDVDTGWCGAVVRVEKAGGIHVVHLQDRRGRLKGFPLGPGFLIDGAPVVLTPPRAARDRELVEKVWGDDLRVEGVVVELLEGVDDLEAAVRDFSPGPGRRMGVLVDHLVPGTKESATVTQVAALREFHDHLLIVGHPYVDVWQSVRPQRLGWQVWPVIPRGQSWKHGILRELGWPHATQADVARGWKQILGTVRTYADLEPALLGRVEELIDFVTAP